MRLRELRRHRPVSLSLLVTPVAAIVVAAVLGVLAVQARTVADASGNGINASDWAAIRSAYERHRHEVVAVANEKGEWQARNPGQQWLTRFDTHGFSVEPAGGGWTWGLALTSYGTSESLRAVGAARASVEGQRVTYRRAAQLDEWIVNDQRGLEHGFTLHQRPSSEPGPLIFDLTVVGTLRPQVENGGRDIRFVKADGTSAVNYIGLKVVDAEGRVLPAWFEPRSDERVRLHVIDHHARYPVTIDPVAQQAYLKASNTETQQGFGYSVAVSGDTVVVSAPGEDSNTTGVNGEQSDDSAFFAGAVYVFVRSGGIWSQQAYLKASNTEAEDHFGQSVAISGDTVVIGAPLEDSAATGVNGDQTDNSADQSGAAYVFTRSGGIWSQQAYLKASKAVVPNRFGGSVAISGDTVVVSADWEDAAYVFVRSGGVWSQQVYLTASAAEGFGYSVAVSGNTVVVGAPFEDSAATGVDGDQTNTGAENSGAAYVFVRSGGVWSQQAYLKASNTGTRDEFGQSVAVSGDTVVVGAPNEDSNATGVDGDQTNDDAVISGAAYVFVRSGDVWSQQAYLKASNTDRGDIFGVSVAVSGDTVIVGAPSESSNATGTDGDQTDNSADLSGAAYVFVRSGGIWSQHAYLKASNTDSMDFFGWSAAVSGNTVVVGAYGEDSDETGVNGDQTNNSAIFAGAAYVFTISGRDVVYAICPLYDPDKPHQPGSTLPLRIQLCDTSGKNVSTPDVTITALSVFNVATMMPGVPDDAGRANPEGKFRYTEGQYVFNLSLKGLKAGTWGLNVGVEGDPTTYTLYFRVK